jgi:serine/threonine-protein kinase RsbW
VSRTSPVREFFAVLSTSPVTVIVHLAAEVQPLLEGLTVAMSRRNFSPGDMFGVKLSVDEALVNALKHGNSYNPERAVRVRYHVGDDEVIVEVEDEGPGFDPDDVADPLDPENLERPCGRGLFLMRRYMSWVRYEGRGNRVVLGKRRSLA